MNEPDTATTVERAEEMRNLSPFERERRIRLHSDKIIDMREVFAREQRDSE